MASGEGVGETIPWKNNLVDSVQDKGNQLRKTDPGEGRSRVCHSPV